MSWLRLPGFDAGDPRLIHDDEGYLTEVQVDCVPNKMDVAVCCLAQKLVKHDLRTVPYRDLRIDAAPTWLHVPTQRYKCRSCGKTVSQIVPHMDAKHDLTERFRDAVVLSAIKRTFADVYHVHGADETLARRLFRAHADEKLLNYRYPAPRVLGIDENALLGAQRGVICDVEKGFLLDMMPGCTKSAITFGLNRMDDWGNVEVWCQDMAGHYKGIAKEFFPKAAIVVDKFHLLRLANHWWATVRRQETPGLPEELRKRMPGMIRLFDKHWETMDDRQQDRVAEVLGHSQRMKTAWTIKESFYYFYDATTRADAESAYKDWVQFAKVDQHDVWKPLMKTVANWRKYIFNYFDHPYTSGMVERMNRSIGDINRAANGMDFSTLRAKAILRYSHLIPARRFDMHLQTHEGAAATEWMSEFLDPSAYDEDAFDDAAMLGSGFDPSTLVADLKDGTFDAPPTSDAG